uniref:Uncharacterized protein n=1 Tax=Arundo donax TaxID=35708 RepID=A0A0A8ZWS8_ARUDO
MWEFLCSCQTIWGAIFFSSTVTRKNYLLHPTSSGWSPRNPKWKIEKSNLSFEFRLS